VPLSEHLVEYGEEVPRMEKRISRPVSVLIAVTGAVIGLLFLMASMASTRTQAAPLSEGTGGDPRIESAIVTSDMPISDTRLGDGVSKIIYFNNLVAGDVTATFAITGTPVLTFNASAAFDKPSDVLTSPVRPVTFTLVYAVEPTHTTQSNVWYTATNSSGQQTGITLTFAQDVTGPVASIVSPPADYFTGTQLVITGTAADNGGGSGVRIVHVMTGTTWGTATGTANWAYTTTVSATDDATITLSARGTDYVSAVGVTDTRVITVDNVLPGNPSVVTTTDGTSTGSWANHSTIPVSWTDVSDGSGVTYYYVWDQSASTAVDASDAFTTAKGVTGTALAEGSNYFHVRSRDGAGNWAADTAHLGPLQVDTVSPTVGISPPVSGAVLTSTHKPTVVISGTSADTTSAVAAVEVMTDTTWDAATDTDPWSYDWTLPSADNEVFTLTARATDEAGNVDVSAAVPVTVDTVLPGNPSVVTTTDCTSTGSWVNDNTIPVSWTVVSDGSDVTYYYVWDQSASTAVDASDAFTTATELTRTGLADGNNYFHVRSRDGAGNWAADTAHLGPLQVDTVSPTVGISTPVPGAVLTTTHQPTVVITGTSADATSSVAGVDVMTNTTWNAATDTDPWSYDWTLPSADNEVFTLTARATDEAGNVAVSAAVLVTVDTVAPAATPPVPDRSPWVTSTVHYTWTEPSDGAGIARYQVNVTNTVGYSAFFWTSSPELTFTEANSEGDDYYARVRAVDTHGNVGDWSGPSAVVTPDLTPPDLSSPGIVIVSNDAMFVISGTSLFYTNTLGAGSFTVKGDAQDQGTLSGLDVATFSEAFGYTPGDDNNPAVYAQTYDAPAGATESGTIIVTVYDNAGNTSVQAFPYALDGTPPTSDASAPAIARDDIDVTWNADDAQSGVYSTTLWYKKEVAGTWMSDQTAVADSGTFTFAPPAGDGLYLFATVAVDNLGNLESGPTVSETQTLYDTTEPTNVVFDVPENSSTSVFTLSWSADDATSGVVSYTVEYSRTGDTVWHPWQTTMVPATMAFTAPTTETLYTFRLTVYDGAGNTAVVLRTTLVGKYKVYVPLVMSDYRLLANGGFDDGLDGWTTKRGAFNNHGTGMPQSVVWQAGSKQALLGDRNASDGSINVGYGSIQQTFVVNRRYLRLQYQVFTYDIVRGAETGRYFDTLEVSVNRHPDQITDAHRNSRGCSTTILNPTGNLVMPSGGGLAFCGGRSGSKEDTGTLWNSGVRTVTLDMNAYLGETVTLYFAIWSREYGSLYYNDQGFFNTWAYVDNVSLQETDSAGLQAKTLQRPVATPKALGAPVTAVVPGLATSGAGAWVAFGLGPRVSGMANRLRGGAGKMGKRLRRRTGQGR
jgi:hypothetical protein